MSNNAPILRSDGAGIVCGGLHYSAGEAAPYFVLYERGREERGAAGHAEILSRFPELADLAALYLSDIDGAPMNTVEDGWYKLAGALPDGLGERYHAGNDEHQFPTPTGDECLQFFADHCRVSLAEARTIRDTVERFAMASKHSRNTIAKARLAKIMDAMRPRWKREAEACIARHGLVIYGDPWPPITAPARNSSHRGDHPMTYSCSDFLDSIMTALGVTGDDDGPDDQVAEIADKCLAEIARLQAIADPEAAARAAGYTVTTFPDDPGKYYWQCPTGDAHAPTAVAFTGEDSEADAWRAACVDAELIREDNPA